MAKQTDDSTSVPSSVSETCKYKGVRKRKWGKWVSEIRLPNSRERIWLGSYDSPEKAARAFDAALFCLRGHTAKFNFPDDPPEIPGGRSLAPSEIQEVAARFAKAVPPPPPRRTMEGPVVESCNSSRSVSEGTGVQMDSELGSGLDSGCGSFMGSGLDSEPSSFMDMLSSGNIDSGDFRSGCGSFMGSGLDSEPSSFMDILSSGNIGSGDFGSGFGLFPGFDDVGMNNEFFNAPPEPVFDFGEGNFDGGSDFNQDSFLWNF